VESPRFTLHKELRDSYHSLGEKSGSVEKAGMVDNVLNLDSIFVKIDRPVYAPCGSFERECWNQLGRMRLYYRAVVWGNSNWSECRGFVPNATQSNGLYRCKPQAL
jgi:hypothetical protein